MTPPWSRRLFTQPHSTTWSPMCVDLRTPQLWDFIEFIELAQKKEADANRIQDSAVEVGVVFDSPVELVAFLGSSLF